MINPERLTPNERGTRLQEITTKATRMVIERINLEQLDLDLKMLPLCELDDADIIEDFIPRAKTGFAYSLKANLVLPGEIRKLLEITTPLVSSFATKGVTLKEEENTLPEFYHTLATLAYLKNLGRVTFFDFSETNDDIAGETGFLESYWNFNTFSIDHLWTMMEDIEKLTRRTLYQETPMPIQDLLKVGHFFAAGKQISSIFNQH